MFNKGEYIHYGSAGLCKVEEITTLNMSDTDADRLYYRLTPVRSQRGMIYTPVDNQKVQMRRALSRSEAEELVLSMPDIEVMDIPVGKRAEEVCKAAVSSPECRVWVSLIKALHQRRESRLAAGRKATSTEERYFREARERLYAELANALEIRDCDVDAYIEKTLTAQAV